MRSSRVWGACLQRRAGKRVVKSMLGKCGQIWACAKRLCCQSLWEGVMELRLVTSYSPPLPPPLRRLLLPSSLPQSDPITIPY